jgi:hypothetical protein
MPVYLVSEPLVTIVLEPNSVSRSCVDRDCESMLRVVRRYSKLLGRRGLRRWEAFVYRQWAGRHLGQGSAEKAIAPAWKRLLLQPFSPEAWWIVSKAVCQGALAPAPRAHAASNEPGRQELQQCPAVRQP